MGFLAFLARNLAEEISRDRKARRPERRIHPSASGLKCIVIVRDKYEVLDTFSILICTYRLVILKSKYLFCWVCNALLKV